MSDIVTMDLIIASGSATTKEDAIREAGNLLLKADRPAGALAAAKRFLLAEDDRNLICPGVNELARRVGDFAALSEAAKARNDAVGYLASLIAAKG